MDAQAPSPAPAQDEPNGYFSIAYALSMDDDIPEVASTTSAAATPIPTCPEFTFIWRSSENQVLIPRVRSIDEFLTNPLAPMSERLSLTDLFHKQGMPFELFETSYNRIIRQEGTIEPGSSQITLPDLPDLSSLEISPPDEPEKVPANLECPICVDGNKPNVIFRECCHAFCSSCVKEVWRSFSDRPNSFCCPFCRVLVKEVADMIPEAVNRGDSAYHVKYDEDTIAQLEWVKILEWVVQNRDKSQKGLEGFFVVTLKKSGAIVIKRIMNGEQVVIQIPAKESLGGLSVGLWVFICFTKIADIYAPNASPDLVNDSIASASNINPEGDE